MRHHLRGAGLAGFAALCLLTSSVLAETPPAQGGGAATVDGARIIDADKEPGNWLSTGRTYAEQRYSPLNAITTDNVKQLGLAWSYETGGNRGHHATPIVIDGTMYVTAPWSIVTALDARTGKALWTYDPEVPREWGKFACCDVVNRGVAVWEGKVIFGTLDARLVAVDAATGKKAWEIDTKEGPWPYTITGAPRVVKGKVIIGNGGAEYGVRGYVTAYDAATGKQLWRFYTVPGDPAKPFENPELAEAVKTWTGEWWKMGGGGSVWDSMAFDPDLNTLYVGTGNGSPWARHLRSPGGGDNLFLSSILAIDPDTGRLKWHYQTTPGDTWDYTATQHMILAELTIDGKPRKVIMQAPKNGFFYVLDRETGQLISARNYVTVTWASGIDMATGRPIENPDARWADKPAVVMPSPIGGHNWQPMAFNPDTGLVYIPTQEIPGLYAPDGKFAYSRKQWNTGTDNAPIADVDPAIVSGALIAWDPVNQKEVWRAKLWGPWNGGVLTTAGNLVFQGTSDGKFNAYDARTGERLWTSPTQTGVQAAPVTFTVDGEQYVSVVVGYGGAYALAYGRAAKALDIPVVGRVLTYKIGGTTQLPKPDLSAAVPPPPANTAPAEVVARGAALFAQYCMVCHGAGAVSGGVLPDLRHSGPVIHQAWKEIVLGGMLKDNGMVSFADVLKDEDADAIHAYVISRAHEGDVPGTPAK
ncbi:MAG: PQQ-dependent dehydrogenase, methanol/ethanol family [Zavarzinia sp.]|nr:PQQ-dependent dehydrogenase, methanol/ethanol family [Zavarzinia sp.]